jgi:hypothetical protein
MTSERSRNRQVLGSVVNAPSANVLAGNEVPFGDWTDILFGHQGRWANRKTSPITAALESPTNGLVKFAIGKLSGSRNRYLWRVAFIITQRPRD